MRQANINIHRPGTLIVLLAVGILAAGLLALLSAKPSWAAEPNFESARNFPVGTAPTTVTNADFDHDGDMDLAAQNFGSDNVSVLLAKGDGTFQPKTDYTVGDGPTAVVSGQFNDDNADGNVGPADFVDLAVANQLSDNVSVLLGKGDGTFGSKTDFSVDTSSTGADPVSLIGADFNGDGKADLAVANSGNAYVRIMLGNGAGDFQAAGKFSIATESNQIISADFNNDSKADLAVTYYGAELVSARGGVTVYLGNGDGTFRFQATPLRLFFAFSVNSGDFNNDGKADLAATGLSSDKVVSVALGNGDGTFQGQRDFGVGTNPAAVTSADLDGDGDADLAVANHDSDNISVLSSNGDGSFQAARNFPAGDGPIFVIGADLNADDYADLAVANDISNNVSVLLNTTAAPPPETTITSGPFGRVNSTSATFAFTSSEPGSTFQCALDNSSAYSPCTSPRIYNGLSNGSHTFYVKATGASNKTDPTPAKRTWTVDTTAPRVTSATPTGTGIGRGTNLTATFSEKMAPASISKSTFKLFKVNADGSTTQITNVTVTLSADSLKATLNPFGTSSTLLARGTKYKAVITTGAKDLAGNALDQNATTSGNQSKTWTFVTGST